MSAQRRAHRQAVREGVVVVDGRLIEQLHRDQARQRVAIARHAG